MLFNTYTYGLFLLVVFSVYLVLPLRGRQIFLLAASYVFYCWEKPIYGTLLAASTVLDYCCGLGLEKAVRPRSRKLILLCSVLGNLGILFFFKYSDFLGENIAGLGRLLGFDTHWRLLDFVLPVGISFYTFQTMAYTIQVYRHQVPTNHDFISFALYVAFFPQLVAGPIERADHLLPQLKAYHHVHFEDIRAGLTRILIGLFRKLVIADRLAIFVDKVFAAPGEFSTLSIWMSLVVFTGQVYFDFAGYCDIAIGTARLFGVRLTENFRRPWMAHSVGNFWDRWHLTLTNWLRDYVFFPIGGSRRSTGRTLFNIWVLFVLVGWWHGARWNYVFWGAYYAFLVSCHHLWGKLRLAVGLGPAPRHPQPGPKLMLSILVTFFFTCMNATLFRSPTLAKMGEIFRSMAGRHAGAGLATEWDVWLFAGIIAATLVIEYLQEYGRLNEQAARLPREIKVAAVAALAVVTILFSVNNLHPYIYFQF